MRHCSAARCTASGVSLKVYFNVIGWYSLTVPVATPTPLPTVPVSVIVVPVTAWM